VCDLEKPVAKPRTYKFLCPIARAVDRIGDRWTLLILRDLHAGPARFSELQQGLTGIAANLLTKRLNGLVSDNLVTKKKGEHGTTLYKLTESGHKTRGVLFELAMLGRQYTPQGDVIRPGNLRSIAVTLGTACQRAIGPHTDFVAEISVDGESFSLIAKPGHAKMAYQTANSPDLELETTYESILALTEGEMSFERFSAGHCKITVHTTGKEFEFMSLLTAAQTQLQG
jgi:DNA-binding HxlR family transcriptional regulator